MSRTESEVYSSPTNSTSMLAKDLKEMDQSVKQMLKLIEEDGCDSISNNSDVYQQKRPELIAHIESFCTMYRSLAERCDQSTENGSKGVPSDQIQIAGSGISDQVSPQRTPAHQADDIDMSLSSGGGGSSDPSLKGGSESFSSSSSDSESDSYNSSINNYLDSPMKGDGKERKMFKLAAEVPSLKNKFEALEEVNGDSILVESKHGDYDELLGVVGRYEEELKMAKLKLQRSEEEVARLKIELEKNEATVLLEAELRAQLEAAQRTIKDMAANLDVEKRHGFQMQEQIALLETQVSDSNLKIKQLMEAFKIESEKLRYLDEENAKLRQEVECKVSKDTQKMKSQLDLERARVLELQENIARYQDEASDRDHEVRELEAALCDAHMNFSNEKAQLQSEITKLMEDCTGLNAKLKEWELRSKSLEDKLKLSEAEKLEMKSSTEELEFGLRGEINGLKAELIERGQQVENLNKTLDGLKLRYDMLMAEKDEANAKIQNLIAEGSAMDSQIQQVKDHIGQLRMQNANLVAGSEDARKLGAELRLKVEGLEKEVERQRVAISNGAEEKREAIRQLCFSLEHYRSGYKELLRQAFVGQRRHAVMAS